MNNQLKTPISYYGGKQMMLKHILPIIPDHKIYVEPFFGGGAVFWAKEPSKTEIVNDVNMNIVNFYEVLKHNYFDLRKRVEATLHSRETYKKAMIIYQCPWLFDDDKVIRAWAFWIVTSQGFCSKIGSWGYDKGGQARTISNKIDAFQERLSDRLRLTQIEQNEAHKVIKSRDTIDTFVYADPPYIDTNQGHYGGYTHDHFMRDLKTLSDIQGKFLLSTYPLEMLTEFTKNNGWFTLQINKKVSVSKYRKPKIEVLTANYKI